ncbi:hypothetical protein C8Q76DRAFT_255345 [Earliella scabrosa]|nr:hypothetical protein C8Q76DRAFT_255345 [Earliella scabrosa]
MCIRTPTRPSTIIPTPMDARKTSLQTMFPYHVLWTSRGAMLLGESIVLGWTLKKTGWKRSTRAAAVLGNGCTQTLSDVLLNNGIACFAVPLALNAVTLALDIVATDASLMVGQCIVSFRDALTTNLISRFLLDLGAFGTHQCAPSSETDISDGRDMPTIHFASGVFDAKSRTETETVMMSPTDSELRSGWSGDICGYEMRSRAA